MSTSTHVDALSQVYARSLYELAHTAGGDHKVAEVADELEQVCELLRGNRALRELFGSPVIDRDARGKSIGRMFNNRVTDLLLRFLMVLNQNGRLGALEGVNSALDSMVQAAQGRIEVDAFTASPMSKEQAEDVRAKIQRALKVDPVLHCYTDERMIGGIRLRIGDQMIDGSVVSRLRKMKAALLEGGAARLREQMSRAADDGGRNRP